MFAQIWMQVLAVELGAWESRHILRACCPYHVTRLKARGTIAVRSGLFQAVFKLQNAVSYQQNGVKVMHSEQTASKSSLINT